MKTIDITLLVPDNDEISACYRMGLKSLNINGTIFPVFAVRIDKKDVFLERLKDEFGSEFKVEDLSIEIDSGKTGIINVIMYNEFLKG